MPAVLDDNAVELAPLGRVGPAFVLDERHRRAADGGEQGAQLVAHHAEELRPQLLELLEWRKDLQSDDHGLDLAPARADGRRVDQWQDHHAAARPRAPGEERLHRLGPRALGVRRAVAQHGGRHRVGDSAVLPRPQFGRGRGAHDEEGRAGDARRLHENRACCVDEGSLATTVQAHDLPCIADALRIPRVVLIGDGKPFAQLQRAGMSTAVMDEIMRQCDPALKEAVEASLAGDVACAFDKFGGNIEAVKSDNVTCAAAARWLALSPEARANAGLMTLRWNLTVRAK